ncbi:uncharacterized protein IUM83_09505 [Phytophthora cinnamomi]|uniref:uncharacterized protein n=1 Tax=Phytophthora cinnamomi TaxID=4785 RepID=UPI0035598A56|nr:hypothetical protein IUM83_09505 [Phytophthora cinnamomi]
MVYENGWHELVTEGRWTAETNSGDLPNELGDEPSVVNENGWYGFATESCWIQMVASTEDRTNTILAASGRAEATVTGMDGWWWMAANISYLKGQQHELAQKLR